MSPRGEGRDATNPPSSLKISGGEKVSTGETEATGKRVVFVIGVNDGYLHNC